MSDIRQEQLATLIREWVLNTEGGSFSYEQLDRDLIIKSPTARNTRRQIIKRMKDEGVIVSVGHQAGLYRLVIDEAPVIKWQTADANTGLDIILPFGLQDLVRILPKTIIVVAGAPDSGKSAFCFNVIKNNMKAHRIVYFSSEMGEVELHSRLSKFNTLRPDEWTFDARERSSNFADIIRPDWINIVDYLEVSTDFFMVGGWIGAIWEKLNQGIAIICLQKKKGVELGRGGEVTAEKARLYLAMDSGRIRIVKAKNWVDSSVNPNGKTWAFKLAEGCKFVNIQEVNEY